MALRFDGLGAGLGFRSKSGDRNDPVNYTLLCAAECGAVLGPLARFRIVNEPGAEASSAITYEGSGDQGVRFCRCGRCGRGVIVKGTQVVKIIPKDVLEEQERQIRTKRLVVP